jgi:hypothetical protein
VTSSTPQANLQIPLPNWVSVIWRLAEVEQIIPDHRGFPPLFSDPAAPMEEAVLEGPAEEVEPRRRWGLRRLEHVVIVVFENQNFSDVIGSSAMPYINELARQNAFATQFYANVHPSIGNYFMMTTGQVVSSDDNFPGTFAGDDVIQALTAAGKTWKVYAESLPMVGYIGGDQILTSNTTILFPISMMSETAPLNATTSCHSPTSCWPSTQTRCLTTRSLCPTTCTTVTIALPAPPVRILNAWPQSTVGSKPMSGPCLPIPRSIPVWF